MIRMGNTERHNSTLRVTGDGQRELNICVWSQNVVDLGYPCCGRDMLTRPSLPSISKQVDSHHTHSNAA